MNSWRDASENGDVQSEKQRLQGSNVFDDNDDELVKLVVLIQSHSRIRKQRYVQIFEDRFQVLMERIRKCFV